MRTRSLAVGLAIALAGCAGSAPSGPPAALTEHDFAADPELATDGDQVGVTFLEPTDVAPGAGDTGSPGVDLIPIRISTERTFTYALDPSDLSGTIQKAELLGADGTVLLTLESGASSGTVTLPPGTYRMAIHSGWSGVDETGAESRAVFLEPEQVAEPASSPVASVTGRVIAIHERRLLRVGYCPGCDLSGADLRGKNLNGARLSGANLSSAKLQGAQLRAASLDRANLKGAFLSDADLFGASLLGADLTGATHSGTILGLATWPDGTICREVSKGTCLSNAGVTEAAWTIFVYGHGDHNLNESLVWDVYRMTRASLSTQDRRGVNVLVAADFCAGNVCNAGRDFLNPWDPNASNPAVPLAQKKFAFATGTQFWRVTGDGAPPKLVGSVTEQNLDDPAVLQRWLALTFKAYPARHYAVVLWDHGGSWDGGFGGDWQDRATPPWALGMQATTVASTVDAGLREAGFGSTRKLDFLAFDTCLMAANEVIWNFRDLTELYIANAELDFGLGLAYEETFSWIASNPDVKAMDLGRKEVELWNTYHSTPTAEDPLTMDLLLRAHAVFDMTKLPRYQQAVKGLVDTLLQKGNATWSEVGRARAGTLPQYGSLDENLASNYFDFGQFLAKLEATVTDDDVKVEAKAALEALLELAPSRSMGQMRTAAGQLGLHTAIDTNKAWGTRALAYRQLPWDAAVRWSLVVDRLASENRPSSNPPDGTGPEFLVAALPGLGTTVATLLVTPSLQATDSAEGRTYVQMQRTDGSFLHGLVARSFRADATPYDVSWKGSLRALVSSSGTTDWVHAEPFFGAGAFDLWRFPAVRTRTDGTVLSDANNNPLLTYAVFDGRTGEVSYLLLPSSVGWSVELASRSSDYRLVPAFPSVDENNRISFRNWSRGNTFLIPKAGAPKLKVQFATVNVAAAGPTFVTFLRDIWGNESMRSVGVPLPVGASSP